ncbi:MAG: hypothetical protein GY847_07010 [Proteobacteria bacterium]|nr:hypothetical protein [Pseudomonadota bacterium]
MSSNRTIGLVLLPIAVLLTILAGVIMSLDLGTLKLQQIKTTNQKPSAAKPTKPKGPKKVYFGRLSGDRTSSPPAEGIFHDYFPLSIGTKWEYRTTGPKESIPQNTWTLESSTLPDDNNPGVLKFGYGDDRSHTMHIWRDGESIRLVGLPLVKPKELRGKSPGRVKGAFLPGTHQLITGAVWTQELVWSIRSGQSKNKRRGRAGKTTAEQRDRAYVESIETTIVPAGSFEAVRITWLSRFFVKSKGRSDLNHLDDTLFRKEQMWLARGVGIVKRRIEYSGKSNETISFDLEFYDRPANGTVKPALVEKHSPKDALPPVAKTPQ